LLSYRDLSGNSSIIGYEIGIDYIDVKFNDYSIYRYSYSSCGKDNVKNMGFLAMEGSGLCQYIIKHCYKKYERKLSI